MPSATNTYRKGCGDRACRRALRYGKKGVNTVAMKEG